MKTKKIGFRVQGLGIRIHTICTLFLSTALGLFFSPDCFANVLISKVSGKVEIYKGESQTAILAQAGNLLENNDCLKTLENGRIQLVFEDGSVIWLKENTEIKLSSLIYSEREIYLNRGRVRVRVTALKNSAKFSLKTPTAVAALRGTEFIMIATENDSNLLVLSGKVEMSSLITETGATPRVELISEGQKSQVTIKGEMSAPQEFTPEDLIIIQDDTWHKFEETIPEKTPQPGEQKEPEKKSELKEEKVKEEISQLKQEIRQFVQETKKEIAIINNIVREVRQSDFSTARTLRDINGNVVRVEQNLLRPDSYTVELLCLTQRDSYVYGGKFNYEGPSSKRTDYLDQKIVFNKALP
ncbi:MAG: FecR family protein, partial [Elusimicrobiota bacterium]